jgi:hypothetical protein
MEKQRQINRKKGTGSTTRYDDGSIGRKMPAVQGASAGPEPLDMNGYIRRLARSISPALKDKIGLRTDLGDEVLPVMVDPARIATIFAALVACGSRLTHGGMTIFTALLPLDVGPVVRRAGNWCALLSFRAAGARGEEIPDLSGLDRDRMLPALFNVWHIVGKHHGCFRLCVGENEIIFNVYLPVMQQSSVCRVGSETVFGGGKERL